MSGEPEYTPAPTPRVSVPVPAVPPKPIRPAEPPAATPPLPPNNTVPPGYGRPSPGGFTGWGSAIAITILSLLLLAITVFGILGSVFSSIAGSGPQSAARDGWTPARELYLAFPTFGGPVVTFVAIARAILSRWSGGRWALWLIAGYALVILFILIGIIAMRGAPPWE